MKWKSEEGKVVAPYNGFVDLCWMVVFIYVPYYMNMTVSLSFDYAN